MNFGIALALLEAGKRVARTGWNGKGMFIYLVGPGRYEPTTNVGLRIAITQPDELVPYRSYIAMKTVDGDVVPWVASQSDLLCKDWSLAEGETIDFDTIEAAADEMTVELQFEDETVGFEPEHDFLIIDLGPNGIEDLPIWPIHQ